MKVKVLQSPMVFAKVEFCLVATWIIYCVSYHSLVLDVIGAGLFY